MATIANQAATVVGIYGLPGVQPELRTSKEKASQTFIVGSFLNDDTAGFLRQHASDNDGDIVGVAQAAGQNKASDGLVSSQYIPMVPSLLMEMSFLGATDGTHVLAQTDLWVGYQYQLTGTVVLETIDATTTTPRVFCVKIELDGSTAGANRGIIGDTNARVYVVPVGSLCAVTPDA